MGPAEAQKPEVYDAPCTNCGGPGIMTEHSVSTGKCLVDGCGVIDPEHENYTEIGVASQDPEIRLTVLISARRNSKYLAKFLFGLIKNTSHPMEAQVMVMLNEHDDWNNELVHYFSEEAPIDQHVEFFRENMQLGRAGLHRYFNELVQQARGDWIVYFCEDHFITMDGWDDHIRNMVNGKLKDGDCAGKQFPLNPDEPWVLVPKFGNCGAMNHVVSRGFVEAMGGQLSQHGWLDSYINDLMAEFPERVIRFDDEMFHDFTHDDPSPMSEAHVQSVSSEKGKHLPAYDSEQVRGLIKNDQEKIKKYTVYRGKREV